MGKNKEDAVDYAELIVASLAMRARLESETVAEAIEKSNADEDGSILVEVRENESALLLCFLSYRMSLTRLCIVLLSAIDFSN